MDTIDLGEIFFDDSYSIEKLLNKSREKGLNLSKLRDSLVGYQQDLNQTSLELFDNNYDRFYKLSYLISCLNEPIQRLVEPIDSFKDKVAQLCKSHGDYLKQIDNKLVALEDTCRNKELAKHLIVLIIRRDRIEEQLSNVDWSIRPIDRSNISRHTVNAGDPDLEYQVKCDLLERISVELYYLNNQIRAIVPTNDELIPIKRSLEISVNERRQQIDNWFESMFLEAIEMQDSQSIDLVVRTYRQKDALRSIDEVWREKRVKPYFKLTITDNQLSIAQLTKTYNLLIEFLEHNLKLIGVKFIVKSFWDELVTAMNRLDEIFSLGDLETFRFRYEETRRFLNLQDHYIDGEDKFYSFSRHDAESNKTKILGKFNLISYFNHRMSQIATSVETSLSSNPLGEPNPQIDANSNQEGNIVPSNFKIKICLHIYIIITKCLSPELYIDTLELNFMQLVCRILNRFADWLSKLRLSDFRITGPSLLDKQTNFLAKQDAIMRLLIEDCGQLDRHIVDYFEKTTENLSEDLSDVRKELLHDSLKTLESGLTNVRSLQRLIER